MITLSDEMYENLKMFEDRPKYYGNSWEQEYEVSKSVLYDIACILKYYELGIITVSDDVGCDSIEYSINAFMYENSVDVSDFETSDGVYYADGCQRALENLVKSFPYQRLFHELGFDYMIGNDVMDYLLKNDKQVHDAYEKEVQCGDVYNIYLFVDYTRRWGESVEILNDIPGAAADPDVIEYLSLIPKDVFTAHLYFEQDNLTYLKKGYYLGITGSDGEAMFDLDALDLGFAIKAFCTDYRLTKLSDKYPQLIPVVEKMKEVLTIGD